MQSVSEQPDDLGPVVVKGLHDRDNDADYWLTRPITERVAAIEILRQRMWGGPDGVGSGLKRVCRVTYRQRG